MEATGISTSAYMSDILGLVLTYHLLFYANDAIDKQKQIVEHVEGTTPKNRLRRLNSVIIRVINDQK